MTEKTLPNNLDAERSVLGAIIRKPECVGDVVDILGYEPMMFHIPPHQHIYNSILTLHREGKSIDTVTLFAQIEVDGMWDTIGGAAYISDLSGSVPTSANVKHYAKIVKDLYTLRYTIDQCHRVIETAYKNPGDVQAFIQRSYGNVSAMFSDSSESSETTIKDEEPPITEDMMHIPGFIDEYISYINSVSIYQNRSMAFAGALCMMSYLVGRNTMDCYGTRGNIYVLGLAESGSGKDKPRQVNKELAYQCGLYNGMGDLFASYEGLEDAMAGMDQPCMFYQTDEVDSMINSIASGNDARYERLMGGLLTLYTSSGSSIKRRSLAGETEKVTIRRPYLSVFGTAIPQHYYSALSERMLNNGWLSRQFIVENMSKRVPNPAMSMVNQDIPDSLVNVARYWARDRPVIKSGDIVNTPPPPQVIVNYSDTALVLDAECRQYFDNKWNASQAAGDSIGNSVWARTWESQHTLAILYACSENYKAPMVTRECVEWAHGMVVRGAKRMLYQSSIHVYSSEHEKNVQKVIRCIQSTGGSTISKRDLQRKMSGLTSRQMDDILNYMHESETARLDVGARGAKVITLL